MLYFYRKSKQKKVISAVDPGLHSQQQEVALVNSDEASIANGAATCNGTDNASSPDEHSANSHEDSDQSHLIAETRNDELQKNGDVRMCKPMDHAFNIAVYVYVFALHTLVSVEC